MHHQDKNILVVGGTSGIGKAIVEGLEAGQANVWIASRHAPEFSTKAKHLLLDVLSDDLSVLSSLPDQLHGLVYCPGTITLKPLQALKASDFQRDFDLNVLGAVKVVQACLKPLRNAKGASIVLYSTVAATVGLSYHASIAAAKGAVEGLGKSIAAELASKHIRCNVVAPSLTDTPLAGQLLATEEKKEASDKRHPLGRYGQPVDIANLSLYLLSDDSSWMTGQVLNIDGGLSSLKPL